MKIAIQGHPTRGKEIIQILRSLGATSYGTYDTCSHPEWYWYINKNKEITCDPKRSMYDYKLYTLEEFEKEFPFKVGDIVLLKGTDLPYEIVALEWFMNKLCYKLDNGLHYAPNTLTTYEKMKEERNITLTLEKAKEWYKKGGELKEIALQAFTEEELTNGLPKTWEEFCEKYRIKKDESYINSDGKILSFVTTSKRSWDHVCPSRKSAEAHLAMIQLEQLRDCYRGLFVTIIGMPIWNISMYDGKPRIFQAIWGKNQSFLSFQSREVAEKYLKNFKPLIEKAGDLIS